MEADQELTESLGRLSELKQKIVGNEELSLEEKICSLEKKSY
jgi:hypothetical protein